MILSRLPRLVWGLTGLARFARSLVPMKYQLEKWLYSYWQKETRFYRLELCQNLWGEWIIKRTWGSAFTSNK